MSNKELERKLKEIIFYTCPSCGKLITFQTISKKEKLAKCQCGYKVRVVIKKNSFSTIEEKND